VTEICNKLLLCNNFSDTLTFLTYFNFKCCESLVLYIILLEVAQWCRSRGASTPPKVLICRKSGQNLWKSTKVFTKSLKIWAKWRLKFAESHEDVFLEVIPKKVFMSVWEKIFAQKFPRKLCFSGKNLFAPQKFACSYTYEVARELSRFCKLVRRSKAVWPRWAVLVDIPFRITNRCFLLVIVLRTWSGLYQLVICVKGIRVCALHCETPTASDPNALVIFLL